MMENKYELVAWTKNITDTDNARLYVAPSVELELISPQIDAISKCRMELEANHGHITLKLARKFARTYEEAAKLDTLMGKIDYAIDFYLQAAYYCTFHPRLAHDYSRLCGNAISLAEKHGFQHILKESSHRHILAANFRQSDIIVRMKKFGL